MCEVRIIGIQMICLFIVVVVVLLVALPAAMRPTEYPYNVIEEHSRHMFPSVVVLFRFVTLCFWKGPFCARRINKNIPGLSN